MENLRRDVILYVNRLVKDRLANDPNRLNAFRNLELYFENNRNCTFLQRNQMVHQMLGEQNQDLAYVYFPIVQEQYEPDLHMIPPLDRANKLIRLAKLCYCIQFMDLYRQRFYIRSPFYTALCHAVNLFSADLITESQLYAHLSHACRLEFPEFHNELEARLNRTTSLFRLGGGGAGNNPSI